MTYNKKKAEEVAEKTYEPAYYQSSKLVEQGLAMTHEQVSDGYMEGTIDGKIDNYDGQDINLTRGNYGESNVFKEK